MARERIKNRLVFRSEEIVGTHARVVAFVMDYGRLQTAVQLDDQRVVGGGDDQVVEFHIGIQTISDRGAFVAFLEEGAEGVDLLHGDALGREACRLDLKRFPDLEDLLGDSSVTRRPSTAPSSLVERT